MNIHYGKRDILGATRIATLTIDQDRVERTADIVYIIYSLKWRGKKLTVASQDGWRDNGTNLQV
jgi:hypothetical protein